MAYLKRSIFFFIVFIGFISLDYLPEYLQNQILLSVRILLFLSIIPLLVCDLKSQCEIVEMKIYYVEIFFYCLSIIFLSALDILTCTEIIDRDNFYLPLSLLLLSFLNFRLFRLQREHILNRYSLIIKKFGYIDFIIQQSKYRFIDIANSIYTFEILVWPYNGLQFYLRKQDQDSWELIAPKIIAEGFIKDLEKYFGEQIEVKQMIAINKRVDY